MYDSKFARIGQHHEDARKVNIAITYILLERMAHHHPPLPDSSHLRPQHHPPHPRRRDHLPSMAEITRLHRAIDHTDITSIFQARRRYVDDC